MIKNFLLKALRKHASKWIVLTIDLVLIAVCYIFTYFLRYIDLTDYYSTILDELPFIIALAFFSFFLVGSYKGIIRHTGAKDAFNVFFGVSIFSAILSFFIFGYKIYFPESTFLISRGILIIHYLVSVLVLILSRYVFKAFYEVLTSELKEVTNVLIYGAGNAGMVTYGAINREISTDYVVTGFVDDDPNKINKKIDRVKIYSPTKINQEFVEKNDIKEVIISIQEIKSNRLLEITDHFLKLNVQVKIVPPLSKWIQGDLQASQIKQINIDDLLNRKQIAIDNPIVKREVANKVVLVTGAAGSIGSEITRQLSKYNLKMLVLIDQSESPLYDLQQELLQNKVTNFVAIVADVRDVKRMKEVFEVYKPQKVFHAAAYKHVPLMEESPYEAVKINIAGTKNIADLSLEYKIERFVMVSTDKAVNPTNVMGATKRVAELYIGCLSKENSDTKFTITRFGNVLGSNGSVIPLFKKQIELGGPLTVTHPDITRYFMTIPEACKLVLEAGTMGLGGEIYIFDMGQSVKIFDMAKRMITLSGFKYPEEIDIKITGLRPGEKLYEELLANGENTTKTYHDKIMIAQPYQIDKHTIKKKINALCINNQHSLPTEIVFSIKEIVPEYISNNSEFEKLDITT